MVVISKTILVNFARKHADASDPLNEWWQIARKRNWKSFDEMKRDFPSADYVGNDRYVFNIKGNKYRLIVTIFFNKRTIYIRYIGTHAAYNKIDCSTI